MVFKNQEELQAYADWTKEQLRGMVDHVRNSDLFNDEVMGHAVWTLPHRLFIGKAWSRSDDKKAFWIISGSGVPTDHIDLAVAESAREAARHFSMKWQMQSARLEEIGSGPAEGEPVDDIDWRKVAAELQAQAEGLYGLAENDEAWKETKGPLVDPDADATT